jgi:hypothetical protein
MRVGPPVADGQFLAVRGGHLCDKSWKLLECKALPVLLIIEDSLNDQLISQNKAMILRADAGRIAEILFDHPYSIR